MLMKYRVSHAQQTHRDFHWESHIHLNLELPARTNSIIINNFQFFIHVRFSISRYSNCDKNRWKIKEMLETKQNETKQDKKHSNYFLSSRFRFGLTENVDSALHGGKTACCMARSAPMANSHVFCSFVHQMWVWKFWWKVERKHWPEGGNAWRQKMKPVCFGSKSKCIIYCAYFSSLGEITDKIHKSEFLNPNGKTSALRMKIH